MTRHIFSGILLLCCGLVFGQQGNQRSSSAVTVRMLVVDHTVNNPLKEDLPHSYAMEMGLRHQLYSVLGLEVPLKLGVSNLGIGNNLRIAAVDAQARFSPLGGRFSVDPYLLGGYGLLYEKEGGLQRQIPLGAGVDFTLGKNVRLNLKGEYRISDLEGRNSIMFGLGYALRFRGGGKGDRDGDGVIDRDDRCPREIGSAETFGCPDNDGDLVINDEDRCPFIRGPRELLGCPDRDKDGVPDIDDKCPEVPGNIIASGCPDQDGDGILDDVDKCPRASGPAKFNGCPDSDEDGLPDHRDQCPGQAGVKLLRGCPDIDDDGVPDDIDNCPNEPGILLTGCPDRDKDGFDDREDNCPDVAGPNRGCPDISDKLKALLKNAGKSVTFEGRSAIISARSQPILDEIYINLRANPSFVLTIEGHTDNSGTVENSEVLSHARGVSCRGYLVSKGIDAARIRVIGLGSTRPVADNGTSVGREQNNRVAFSITPR